MQKSYTGEWGGQCSGNGCFMEGTAEQYLWMVLHDLGGLVEELGGPAKASARLDTFFTELNAGDKGQHAYLGNEPSFGSPWVYNWAQNPAGTQRVVRRMIGNLADFDAGKDAVFEVKPEGLPGNDDLGAISAMYVWGAIGLYPEIPGEPGLSVHSPLFPKTTLRLADGKSRVIFKADASPSIYIKGLTIDGVIHDSTWLPYDSLVKTGNTALDFTLTDEPSQWGALATPAIAPPSPAKGQLWERPIYDSLQAAFNNCGIGGLPTSCITTSMMVPTPNDSIYRPEGVPGSSYNGAALTLASTESDGLKLIAGLFDPLPAKTRVHALGRDNVISYRQIIKFATPLKGNTLFVLGAGTNGNGGGVAVLTFADGATETVTLNFPDWTSDSPYEAPATVASGTSDADKLAAYVADAAEGDGYRVVYQSDDLLKWSGGTEAKAGRIFYQANRLANTSGITQIQLPDIDDFPQNTPHQNLLHIFGINAADVTY
jgi:hypothetical protein